MSRPKCRVDFCTNSQSTNNKFEMCFHHGDMAKFIIWALPKLQVPDVKKPEETPKKETELWTPESGPSGIIRT